jgi:hypothetical protein
MSSVTNRLTCTSCGKQFKSYIGRRQHERCVHEKPYKCRFCEKKFGTRQIQFIHENQKHTPESERLNSSTWIVHPDLGEDRHDFVWIPDDIWQKYKDENKLMEELKHCKKLEDVMHWVQKQVNNE